MPTVKNFGSYRIMVFAGDHNPPHVHVIGPDFQAKVRIRDTAVFIGSIPPRHRREALAWISEICSWRSGMNATDEETLDILPRVKAVSPARAPWTVNVIWMDGTKDRVDLTGLIHCSRHFRVFLDHPAAFRKLRAVHFGGGIEWENGLDYGADTLKMMADEQRPVSGADLARFESDLNLRTSETAALLGVSEHTVRGYRRSKRLPQSVAIALRTLRASDTVFAAHYRPVGQRGLGRARKQLASKAA